MVFPWVSPGFPQDGRVLGAGAVLRLGGAHLGGYGESDIAYAYRQVGIDRRGLRWLQEESNMGDVITIYIHIIIYISLIC